MRIIYALNLHTDELDNVIKLIPNVITKHFSRYECVSFITENNGGSGTTVNSLSKLMLNSVFVINVSEVSDENHVDEISRLHRTLDIIFESACTG